MALYIDYIYLDVDERRRFAQQSHEYLIDQLQFGLQQTLTTSSARIDLTLNHPVKELVWVFQDARKTDCGSTLTANIGFTQPFSYDDIVNRARLQINGQDRFDERYGDYFWKVQPYQHHTGGAFFPMRSQVIAQGVTTFTADNVTLAGDVMTIAVGATVGGNIVEGALVTHANLPAGTVVQSYGSGNGGVGTYQLSEPALVNASSLTVTFSLPNVNYTPHENPINVYSFALQPEEHQPSGTCNFSRIDTTTLVFDSVSTNGVAKPTKSTPFNFRMYAVNYNIFRVMSGMGGLAYSN
jgi:hypothetical protein